MKKILLIVLLVVLPVRAEVDLDRGLRCIYAVETGGRVRPGKAGEIGPGQMTVIARLTVSDPLGYLKWLARTVSRPTPYRLFLAWMAGPAGMQHPPSAKEEQAHRALNLSNDPTFP